MSGIFVGGTGRCGTAILGAMFAAHPQVMYFNEPRFISDEGGLAGYILGRTSWRGFQHKMLKSFRWNLIHKLQGAGLEEAEQIYTTEAVDDVLHQSMPRPQARSGRITQGRAFIENLLALAMKPTHRYWVEKTPGTVMYADVLYWMFPDMRYIHIIRQPKDTCVSIQRQPWGIRSVDQFCIYYERLMNKAYQAHQHIPPENYLVVSLESFAHNPVPVAQRIYDFVGIPIVDAVIQQVDEHVSVEHAHIDCWREGLSTQHAVKIDAECGALYLQWKAKEVKW